MNDTLVRLAITQSELFSDWPDEAIARLIAHAEVLVVEPGTCVHHTADPAKYLTILVAGSMYLTREMSSGRTFTAGLHLAGEFHGLGPVLSHVPHFFNATCKEKTVLVRIPAELLREMIASNGRLSFSLFAAQEKRHFRALRLHASAAVETIQARVAGLLKSIDARSVSGRSGSAVNLSQDEIATMLGTRRQVVNRALKDMAEEGVIRVEYGRISILDNDKLAQMAPDSN
ncbi:cAMP-binding domain of CRP or a regulatory subunit of cAMP-dependent protein kinases [Polaromonas sp. OV174]|uniref:Crp/Fnr family transcriptional regulator n=1 Tax=Polaromonas sp. OV174 TaxID=1855300 RepID=UPI0008F28DBD|nr:Crp/Fnr family transcriptional regulator [Polaromonas sp. OV174]SFC60454.1 cAMP-binding domain of CRP or a regulatory subunit of cAMP-dependent protein kinases [Polaromonas sp. OV174]